MDKLAVTKQVLVLENLDARPGAISHALANSRHEVSTLMGVDDLVSRLHRERVHLVIVDGTADGIDPFEVLAAISRKREGRPFLPVLVVVAETNEETCRQLIVLGATDFIRLPMESALLRCRAERYLQMKCLHEELAEARVRFEVHERGIEGALSTMLPREIPEFPHWSFGILHRPCGRHAGDFHDLFTLPGGCVAVLIADALGHGVEVVPLIAMVQALARSRLRAGAGPSETLEEINDTLLGIFEDDFLLTLYLGILDPETGRLVHTTAGHNGPLEYDAEQHATAWIEVEGGPPVGVEPGARYRSSEWEFKPRRRLLFATNGVWHERDSEGEEFGQERLAETFAITGDMDVRAALDLLVSQVRTFVGTGDFNDDVTMILMGREASV